MDWYWMRFLRNPDRTRTVDPFYKQCFGTPYRDAFQSQRACLEMLNMIDDGDHDSVLMIPPQLVISAPSADVIMRGLKAFRVQHQDHALSKIASHLSVRLSRREHSKPCVILCPGPTATGKTTTAEALVKLLFGEDVWYDAVKRDAVFHRVDVNTYVDEYSITRLLGAEPGLVTSDKNKGTLINWLENVHDDNLPDRPVSGVLLLDEIEKAGANSRLLIRLMGLFESGTITGSNTFKQLRASKLIIFCCTNAGQELLARRPSNDQLDKAAYSVLRKELVARCCHGDEPSFGRFDLVAPYYGFMRPQRIDICKEMVRERLKNLNKQYEFRIHIDSEQEQEPLLDRLLQIWESEGTNARAIRNFCSNFDALLLQYMQAYPLDDASSSASPLQLRICDTQDGLECVSVASALPERRVAVLPLPPATDQLMLTEWHRLAVSCQNPSTKKPSEWPDHSMIDHADANGRTPLHYAASTHNLAMIKYLLKHGADLSRQDNDGYNVLMSTVALISLTAEGREIEVNLDVSWAQKCQKVCRYFVQEHHSMIDQLMDARLPIDDHSDDESSDGDNEDSGRTVLLVMMDVFIQESEAKSDKAESLRVVVQELFRMRLNTAGHLQWVRHNGSGSESPDVRSMNPYLLDRDHSGRSVIHRLIDLVHATNGVNAHSDHDLFALTEWDEAPTFAGMLDLSFLVFADLDLLASDGVVGCADCMRQLLAPFRAQRCIHRDRACRMAVLRAVHQVAIQPNDEPARRVLTVLEEHNIPIEWSGAAFGTSIQDDIDVLQYILANQQRFVDWGASLSSSYCGPSTGHGHFDPVEWHREDSNILEWFTHARFIAVLERDHSAFDETLLLANGKSKNTTAMLSMLLKVFDRWPQVERLMFPERESCKPVWPQIHHSLLHVYSQRCTGDASDIDVANLVGKILRNALGKMQPCHRAYWSDMIPFPLKTESPQQRGLSRPGVFALPQLAVSSVVAIPPPPRSPPVSPSRTGADADGDVTMDGMEARGDLDRDSARIGRDANEVSAAMPAGAGTAAIARSTAKKSPGLTVQRITEVIDECEENSLSIENLQKHVQMSLAVPGQSGIPKSTFNSALNKSKKFVRVSPKGQQIVLRNSPEGQRALEAITSKTKKKEENNRPADPDAP